MFTAEDYDEAARAHGRLVWRLKRYEGRRARRLARILSRCTGNTPCRSGACPKCGLAHQRAVVSLCNTHIEGPARRRRGRMSAVTIVPGAGCVAPGELTVELCQKVLATVEQALRALALPPTILCLDVSANEDLTMEQPPHWSVHVHGVGLDWPSRAQKAALRAAFPRSALVSRPVKVDPLDERNEGRRYAPKWQRFRRQRYLKVDKTERRKPHPRTRPKSLRPTQTVELALIEHRLGLTARVISNVVDAAEVEAALVRLWWARDGP